MAMLTEGTAAACGKEPLQFSILQVPPASSVETAAADDHGQQQDVCK